MGDIAEALKDIDGFKLDLDNVGGKEKIPQTSDSSLGKQLISYLTVSSNLSCLILRTLVNSL